MHEIMTDDELWRMWMLVGGVSLALWLLLFRTVPLYQWLTPLLMGHALCGAFFLAVSFMIRYYLGVPVDSTKLIVWVIICAPFAGGYVKFGRRNSE